MKPARRNIIANIFDFNDTNVRQIMTDRTDLVAVEDTESVQDVVDSGSAGRLFPDSGVSRGSG